VRSRPFTWYCGSICLLAATLILFVAGCSGDADYKPVDLTQTIKVKAMEDYIAEKDTLRVAVAAMISPKETLVYYQQLLDYIGDQLGYTVRLVQRKTYGEVNELFPKRQVDLAFICTGPYALGKDMFGFEALATPIVRGEPFYRSYLIVNKNSPYKSLADLRGRMFAFTDPESNTGTLVPNFWLGEMNEHPSDFFGSVAYTYSHDNSIMAVAKGLVDGAAVDGHKWEYYRIRNPYYTDMTRVIRRSEPFGSPPLVASVYLPEDVKARIRDLLYSMHDDKKGKAILGELMIERFVAPKEEWYETTRRIYRQLRNRMMEASDEAQDS